MIANGIIDAVAEVGVSVQWLLIEGTNSEKGSEILSKMVKHNRSYKF